MQKVDHFRHSRRAGDGSAGRKLLVKREVDFDLGDDLEQLAERSVGHNGMPDGIPWRLGQAASTSSLMRSRLSTPPSRPMIARNATVPSMPSLQMGGRRVGDGDHLRRLQVAAHQTRGGTGEAAAATWHRWKGRLNCGCGISPAIVIASRTWPTFSTTCTLARAPPLTSIPSSLKRAKPGLASDHRIFAFRDGPERELADPFVEAYSLRSVPIRPTVTLAPGTTAPEASCTMPATAPACCAGDRRAASGNRRRTGRENTLPSRPAGSISTGWNRISALLSNGFPIRYASHCETSFQLFGRCSQAMHDFHQFPRRTAPGFPLAPRLRCHKPAPPPAADRPPHTIRAGWPE